MSTGHIYRQRIQHVERGPRKLAVSPKVVRYPTSQGHWPRRVRSQAGECAAENSRCALPTENLLQGGFKNRTTEKNNFFLNKTITFRYTCISISIYYMQGRVCIIDCGEAEIVARISCNLEDVFVFFLLHLPYERGMIEDV